MSSVLKNVSSESCSPDGTRLSINNENELQFSNNENDLQSSNKENELQPSNKDNNVPASKCAIIKTKRPSDGKESIIFRCDICGKTFIRKGNLNQHLKVHQEKAFSCPECEKKFRYKQCVEIHLMATHGKTHGEDGKPLRYHTCDRCGKTYTHRNTLIQHLQTHDKVKDPSCKDCGRKFRFERILESHIAKYRGSCVENISLCHICGRTFNCEATFREHVYSHEKGPFPCPECDKVFKGKGSLKVHMATHGGYFTCDKCDGKFRQSNHLKQHQKLEHEMKTYPCLECGWKFKTKPSLNIHMDVHKPDVSRRKFECKKCGKCYLSRGGLRFHLKSSRCWVVYECLDCALSFSIRNVFIDHLEDCHDTVPIQMREFECLRCSRRTSWRSTSETSLHERKQVCGRCTKLQKTVEFLAIRRNQNQNEKMNESSEASSNLIQNEEIDMLPVETDNQDEYDGELNTPVVIGNTLKQKENIHIQPVVTDNPDEYEKLCTTPVVNDTPKQNENVSMPLTDFTIMSPREEILPQLILNNGITTAFPMQGVPQMVLNNGIQTTLPTQTASSLLAPNGMFPQPMGFLMQGNVMSNDGNIVLPPNPLNYHPPETKNILTSVENIIPSTASAHSIDVFGTKTTPACENFILHANEDY